MTSLYDVPRRHHLPFFTPRLHAHPPRPPSTAHNFVVGAVVSEVVRFGNVAISR
jgi:hypothetical protein